MDLGFLVIFIWLCCLVLVAVDSSLRRLSSVFWRLATLVGDPFGLLAYGIVHESIDKKRLVEPN